MELCSLYWSLPPVPYNPSGTLCLQRHSTLGLKGITLILNVMTPSCHLQNRLGEKIPFLKMLLSPCMRTAEGLWPNCLLGRVSPSLPFLPLQLLILKPARLHALLKSTAALCPLWAPAIDLDPPIFMYWKRKWLFKKAFVWDLEAARTMRQNGLNFCAWQMCRSTQSGS